MSEPYKAWQPTPAFVPVEPAETLTLDTDTLDRQKLEFRYRQFVDSVQPVCVEQTISKYDTSRLKPSEVESIVLHQAAHALADYLIRELNGLVRLDRYERPMEPDQLYFRLTLPVIRDQKVRDTFTQQLEREREKAFQRGRLSALKEATRVVSYHTFPQSRAVDSAAVHDQLSALTHRAEKSLAVQGHGA